MKYILLILLSFNTFAEIKYTRLDAEGNNQGEFIVDTEQDGIARIFKMLKVKKSWMKCDWKAEAHPLNITRSSTFSEVTTPDDPETIDIDETVITETEIVSYCHPKTFSIVKEDVTDLLAAKKAEQEAEKKERRQIKAMIDNINASDKPNWEKRLLKALIRDLKE